MRNKKLWVLPLLLFTVLIFTSCQKTDLRTVDANTESELNKIMAKAANSNNGYAVEGEIVLDTAIKLTGDQEVPGVVTESKGVAIIRVSNARKLYTKIILQKEPDPADDIIRVAHIHPAKRGVNGPVLIGLCDAPGDFGKNRSFDLTEAQYQALLNVPLYVNAHSIKFPRGIIRGQLRD
jgi:CHRD domain